MHMNVYDAFLQAGGCAVDTHINSTNWEHLGGNQQWRLLPFRNYHDASWCHMPDFSNLPGDLTAVCWLPGDLPQMLQKKKPWRQWQLQAHRGKRRGWIPRPVDSTSSATYLLSLYCRVLFMFFVDVMIFDAHGAFESLTRTSLECVNTIQHV